MTKIKWAPVVLGMGLMSPVVILPPVAAQRRPAPLPSRQVCDWRFTQVPQGYAACRIDRSIPGVGVTLVSRFVCEKGRMINHGQTVPNRASCPNGWER